MDLAQAKPSRGKPNTQWSSLIYNTSARHEQHERNTNNTIAPRVRHEQHKCNTSATRVLHERHECDTSATRTTRVQHEWKILILITTRVKTYFHTPIFTIWQVKDYKQSNNLILRTKFWKCPVRLKSAPQKLNFLMAKAISKSYRQDCSCKRSCTFLHSYAW